MADGLLYQGGRANVAVELQMVRGDDRTITFAHDLGAAANIAEARFEIEDGSGTAVVQLTLADHADQWDLDTDNECTVYVLGTDTAALATGSYGVAVEFVHSDGTVYTPIYGTISLIGDVVTDDDTAAYVSWHTLGQVNSKIAALLAVGGAGLVTVAAALGATSLSVNGADELFAEDDVVHIQTGALGSTTYDETTVASVDGDTLEIDDALTAAVVVGAVVQRGVA